MKINHFLLPFTLGPMALASQLFAAEPTPAGKPLPQPNYTLVFSDDFSTNPNSNGKWAVFRRQHNVNEEGYWNSTEQDWYLTRPSENLATAAFANYELTAKIWKATFNYKVDNGPTGADGFVFMFYKDKAAYGTPDSGTYMAFQTRNSNNSDNPVPGYGVQFDTYQYGGCDPIYENYVAVVKDVICDSAMIYRPFTKVDDNVWHSVEIAYANGRMSCTVDGKIVQGFTIQNPSYTYSGVGFGAGTGEFSANQVIDDFQLSIAQ